MTEVRKPPAYELRPTGGADIDWLIALDQEAFSRPGRWVQHFRPVDTTIITVDGEPVGAYQVEYRGDALHLGNIAIKKEWRRCGIGGAVVAEIQQRARAEHVRLTLSVRVENREARHLYERLGFRVWGYRMDWQALESV